MPFQQTTKQLATNPKRLFLIDGLGALLSAFLLGVVLVQFESTFGIPKATLYFLALLPCFFALFDAYYYFKKSKNLAFGLAAIAYINLSYCALSISLAFYHLENITWIGWAYIISEIAIVSALALIELKTAKELK